MNKINNKSNVWSVKSIDSEIFDLVTDYLNMLNLPDNIENRTKLIYSMLKEPKAYPISKEAYKKTINMIFKVEA